MLERLIFHIHTQTVLNSSSNKATYLVQEKSLLRSSALVFIAALMSACRRGRRRFLGRPAHDIYSPFSNIETKKLPNLH